MAKKILYSVLLTSYKEPITIKKAISQILGSNKKIIDSLELLVITPDKETFNSAEKQILKHKFKNYKIIKDELKGKPSALNLGFKKAKGKILILTDGDMYISDRAVERMVGHFDNDKVGGVSGKVISTNNRHEMFGFFSHLFCNEANEKRRLNKSVHMTGYLYAFPNLKELYPIPEELRAEDGYISLKIRNMGLKIAYEPKATAYVKFPTNTKDWLNQKTRSLGGNYQLNSYFTNTHTRSLLEDLKGIFLPVKFARTTKEYMFLMYLYPLRLLLWIRIIWEYNLSVVKIRRRFFKSTPKINQHGVWDRIKSSK